MEIAHFHQGLVNRNISSLHLVTKSTITLIGSPVSGTPQNEPDPDMPEIEQGLSLAAGRPVTITFTPHLMPMNRGILSTIYVKLTAGHTAADLRSTLETAYADEPFVRVTPEGTSPSTRHVRGSNMALIGVFADRVPGRAILVCAIDNLVKGASGQAIQNMNVMLQIPEITGLSQIAMFP